MIHLALTIVSTIFVIWFFVTCGALVVGFIVLAWRWLLGGIAAIALLVFFNSEKHSNGQVEPVPVAAVARAAAPLEPKKVVSGEEGDAALRDSVRLAIVLPADVQLRPVFDSSDARIEYLRWLGEMSNRLKTLQPIRQKRIPLLEAVWYESKRAGLPTSLVLAVIEVESSFKPNAIGSTGARGYMQVANHWPRTIGDGDNAKLFRLQANLRYGCVILRHYLDLARDDVNLALAMYFRQSRDEKVNQPDQAAETFVESVFSAQRRWVYRAG